MKQLLDLIDKYLMIFINLNIQLYFIFLITRNQIYFYLLLHFIFKTTQYERKYHITNQSFIYKFYQYNYKIYFT